MSRDLCFWRTSEETENANNLIYSALSNEQYLAFVDEIPVMQIQRDLTIFLKIGKTTITTIMRKIVKRSNLCLQNNLSGRTVME